MYIFIRNMHSALQFRMVTATTKDKCIILVIIG